MKKGDFVTTLQARSQNFFKWVVLHPLKFDESKHVVGGEIYAIAETKNVAGDAAFELEQQGGNALIIEGCLSEISLGEVFVD